MPEERTAEELAEEAAADAVTEEAKADGEENKEEEGEEKEGEKEDKGQAKGDVSEEVVGKITNKLVEIMKPGMTPEQQEAELKKLEDASGYNRKQLMFLNNAIQQTSVQANIGLHHEVGRNRAEKVLGALAPELIKEVNEEMLKQPIAFQANPAAWENVAWIIKGKNAEKYTKKAGGRETVITDASGGSKMAGLNNGGKGNAGNGSKGSGKTYDSNEQFIINQYFKGDAKAYEKAKSSKTLDRSVTSSGGTNNADKELERLTAANT